MLCRAILLINLAALLTGSLVAAQEIPYLDRTSGSTQLIVAVECRPEQSGAKRLPSSA